MNRAEHFEMHASKLGRIVGNLQTIEMMARLVVSRASEWESNKVKTDLSSVATGATIEVNALTNNDDLGQVLQKYNKHASAENKIETKNIVNLRDALAHGKFFGFRDLKFLRLLKFSRNNKDGNTVVELAVDMTELWFDQNISFLGVALEKVTNELNYEKIEFLKE